MVSSSLRAATLRVTAAALASSILLLAGCGTTPPSSNLAVVHATSPPTLGIPELERQLASGFRDALGRVAVMQQPKEGAADLGQDLPEGLVRSVRCSAAAAVPNQATQESTTCAVTWRTAAGASKRTAYAVRLSGAKCFAAEARPALADLHDATIHTYAEHPLNRIYSLVAGC